MARKTRDTSLPAPFLRSVRLKTEGALPAGYPYSLPWLNGFELTFEEPVTILVGENGTGKSTLVEALAALAGFGEAGGSRDHGAVSRAAREGSGGDLAGQLRAGWLPKVAAGWFFRAETFFSVARYLDDVGSTSADFLSHSHGEGYLRVFSERMNRQGIYFMDEPESALSPKRQVELLRFLAEVQQSARAQVIMATHSPLLMAVPGAALWRMTPRGIDPYAYRDTDHFRLWQNFTVDPEDFVARALAGDDAGLV